MTMIESQRTSGLDRMNIMMMQRALENLAIDGDAELMKEKVMHTYMYSYVYMCIYIYV
jgi:hypothetical protein